MNTLEIIAEPADPYVGNVLRGRYRLDALLGNGAMGTVYRARDLELDSACAVKLLRVEGRMREAARIRFLDEARLVAEIFHPHIVEMYDHGCEPDGALFLVMELLGGQDLDALLKRQNRLPLEQTLDIVRQLGSALHAVHQAGIVHRDIKPRNIFLAQSATGSAAPVVKLIDFGLAKYLNPPCSNRGSDGLLIGTPEYLPPEAWHGVSAEVDTRADQWALAVLTFRMLSGELPFASHIDTMMMGKEIANGSPRCIRELVPAIPEQIERVLLRALSKSKEGRYPSVQSFVRALLRPGQGAGSRTSDAPTTLRPAVPRPIEPETTMMPVPTVMMQMASASPQCAGSGETPRLAARVQSSSALVLKRRTTSRLWLAGVAAGAFAAISQGVISHKILSALNRLELASKLPAAQAAPLASGRGEAAGSGSDAPAPRDATAVDYTAASEQPPSLVPILSRDAAASSHHSASHGYRSHSRLSGRARFSAASEPRSNDKGALRRESL